MAKEVKIITFINDREGRELGAEELTRLVNDGWKIKTAGGGTGADMIWGFVVLQRHVPKKKNDFDEVEQDGEIEERIFDDGDTEESED
jgi:hypothetical protein